MQTQERPDTPADDQPQEDPWVLWQDIGGEG